MFCPREFCLLSDNRGIDPCLVGFGRMVWFEECMSGVCGLGELMRLNLKCRYNRYQLTSARSMLYGIIVTFTILYPIQGGN